MMAYHDIIAIRTDEVASAIYLDSNSISDFCVQYGDQYPHFAYYWLHEAPRARAKYGIEPPKEPGAYQDKPTDP